MASKAGAYGPTLGSFTLGPGPHTPLTNNGLASVKHEKKTLP